MLFLYRLLTDIAAVPLRMVLRVRAWRGKEEPRRLGERRGLTKAVRPEGRLIWCHAASVGESIALLPVITNLLSDPKLSILMTTGTVSSARILSERLPERVVHQFAPWDRGAWVRRFLDVWRPDVAVRMESELWPNTLHLLRKHGIPSIVVNGRLSEQSARGWHRFPSAAREVMACLDVVLAQSEDDAARFQNLGAQDVRVTGNIKLGAPSLPVDEKSQSKLLDWTKGRSLWLAASTHPGEDEIALSVHKHLADTVPDVLTVIAPRHPHRGPGISRLAQEHGLNTAQRSAGDPVSQDTAVYVADTLGELGTLLSIAPIVFMGKSLTAHGGQNPVEPCHFDCAILFGPHMENFQDIAATMVTSGMALQVDDADELANTVAALMADSSARRKLSGAASAMIMAGNDCVSRTTDAIRQTLGATSIQAPAPETGRV